MTFRSFLPLLALGVASYSEAQNAAGIQVNATDCIIINNTPAHFVTLPPNPIQWDVTWQIEPSSGSPFRGQATPTVTQGPAFITLQSAGRLVNVTAGVTGPGVFAGSDYLQVFLASSNQCSSTTWTGGALLLAAGDIQSYYQISWPNTPIKIPFDQPGWSITFNATTPGLTSPPAQTSPGQAVTFTFPLTTPAGAAGCRDGTGQCLRYRLVSVVFTMATGPSDPPLTPYITLSNGAGVYFMASSPAAVSPGWLTWHAFGAGMPSSNSTQSMTQGLPDNLFLTGIDGPQKLTITWSSQGAGAGPDVVISNIAIRVEVWNDID
jgi:hypothetical protein